jgi:hypothetical protein
MSVRTNCSARLGLVVVALAFSLVPGAALAQETTTDNCLSCHSALTDERLSAPVRALENDVHGASGLGCASCHGGDPTAAGFDGMDPATGFVGRPTRRQLAGFCGRCHSDAAFMRQYNPSLRVDQVAEYVTSVHGTRLIEQGDTAVAICTSCHPAHSITSPSDPQSSVNPLNVAETCGACHASAEYMGGYGIPTDQLEDYRRSVHWEMMTEGGDLSAPTCNDCHGNHGAAPPGITSVGNVCGQCHSVMADNFAQSRHAQTFALIGMAEGLIFALLGWRIFRALLFPLMYLWLVLPTDFNLLSSLQTIATIMSSWGIGLLGIPTTGVIHDGPVVPEMPRDKRWQHLPTTSTAHASVAHHHHHKCG